MLACGSPTSYLSETEAASDAGPCGNGQCVPDADRSTYVFTPCDDAEPPEACGRSCAATSECGTGLYCSFLGYCTSECGPSHACAFGYACNEAAGKCESGAAFVTTSAAPDLACADVQITASTPIPDVYLIIDQSGSMKAQMGSEGETRWNVLRNLLLGTPVGELREGGLIRELQSTMRFGLALYTATSSGGVVNSICPMINAERRSDRQTQSPVVPALDNYDVIEAEYGPASAISETPTGDAIGYIKDQVVASQSDRPTFFVVATDGSPDACSNPKNNAPDGRIKSLAETEEAFEAGIRSFFIAVANESEIPSSHLQDLANAGIGRADADEDAPFYRATTANQLRQDLETILRGGRPCAFPLEGQIDNLARACEGEVRLQLEGVSAILTCRDNEAASDGWRAVDATTIELVGDSCTAFRNAADASLSGTFPCDVATGVI